MTTFSPTDSTWTDSAIDGMQFRLIMGPEEGTGAITMGELDFAPGSLLPLHTHLVEEAFRIQVGQGTALIGDQEVPISAGDAILAPAGMPHGFRNSSSGQLKLTFFYPAINVSTEFVI